MQSSSYWTEIRTVSYWLWYSTRGAGKGGKKFTCVFFLSLIRSGITSFRRRNYCLFRPDTIPQRKRFQDKRFDPTVPGKMLGSRMLSSTDLHWDLMLQGQNNILHSNLEGKNSLTSMKKSQQHGEHAVHKVQRVYIIHLIILEAWFHLREK